jgi:L,D-transpeptidase YcbB
MQKNAKSVHLTPLEKLFIASSILFVLIWQITSCSTVHSEEFDEDIHTAEEVFRSRLKENNWSDAISQLEFPDAVDLLYQLNDQQPLWIQGDSLNEDGKWLIAFLGRPYFRTWLNEHYDFSVIDSCTSLWKKELILTDCWIWVQSDWENGLLDEDFLLKEKSTEPDQAQLKRFLDNWQDKSTNQEERLIRLSDKHSFGRQLQKGLLKWTDTAMYSDELIRVYSMKIDSALTYSKAREILKLTGYLSNDSTIQDSVFFQAIRSFQSHSGLESDGKIGHYTAVALSETNLQRFWRAQLTLEKWRRKEKFPSKFIYVNIPSYTLRFFDSDSLIRTHRIIVGTKENKTPRFSAKMRTVVTYPYWNVPHSIATEELLPSIKRNPGYVHAKGYKLFKGTQEIDPWSVNWSKLSKNNFPYRLRQEGGTSNALGLIKLLFPNPNNVYIHDTPTKPLFARDIRAFSHGCIRCQNPLELGLEILLRDGNKLVKSRSDLDSLIALEREIHLRIRDPFEVYIEYFSVEADENGTLTFFVDVYEHDKLIISRIEERRKARKSQPSA